MQIENFEKKDCENIEPVDLRLLGFDIIIFNAGSNIIRASQGSARLTIQVLISIDSKFKLHVNLLCEAEPYCMENWEVEEAVKLSKERWKNESLHGKILS